MLRFDKESTAQQKLDDWLKTAFERRGALPFSFEYNSRPSTELLKEWKKLEPAEAPGERTLAYEAPDGLRAIVEVRLFPGFPVVEWLLSFENAGAQTSGLIENVRAMDLYVECSPFRTAGTKQFGAHDNILHYSGGSDCKIDDFIPLEEVLHFICNTEKMHFESVGGRPTSGSHGAMPYFNIQTQESGAILALGWSGQWAMDVLTRQREQAEGDFTSLAGMPQASTRSKPCFRFLGGMPDVHLVLHPGERIRSPRALLMPWSGDIQEAHNTFRAFMLAHHAPKAGVRRPRVPINATSWGTRESQHIADINAIRDSGMPVEAFWIDAGWYGPPGTNADDPECQDWARYVGYWEADPSRYPMGMKPVSDCAHKNGLRFLLWLEPDRAVVGSPSITEHPEYFLGKHEKEASLLLNLGKPEARQWVYDMLCKTIDAYGIDVLRIDYNYGEPLSRWKEHDGPDRQGMTQIRAVEGLYSLWDALLARYPDLLIDNCASGGRRLDFEAVTRSVALFRSDYACYADNDPIGMQVQNAGLALYIPFSATSMGDELDWYRFRSTLSQGMNFPMPLFTLSNHDPALKAELRRMMDELLRVRDLFDGDYYALTGVTICRKDWFAYQLHRRDLHRGAVVCFRRDESPLVEACFRLKGLDSAANYLLEDADSGHSWTKSGADLADEGLSVRIDSVRQARLIHFRKANSQ